jgi:hypothetical protein
MNNATVVYMKLRHLSVQPAKKFKFAAAALFKFEKGNTPVVKSTH